MKSRVGYLQWATASISKEMTLDRPDELGRTPELEGVGNEDVGTGAVKTGE